MIRSLTVDETNNLMLGQYGVNILEIKGPIIAILKVGAMASGSTALSITSFHRIYHYDLDNDSILLNTESYLKSDTAGFPSNVKISAVGSRTSCTLSAPVTAAIPADTYVYVMYNDLHNGGSVGNVQFNSTVSQNSITYSKDFSSETYSQNLTFSTPVGATGGGLAARRATSPLGETFSSLTVIASTGGVTFQSLEIDGKSIMPNIKLAGRDTVSGSLTTKEQGAYFTLANGQSINGNITSFTTFSQNITNAFLLCYINPKYK